MAEKLSASQVMEAFEAAKSQGIPEASFIILMKLNSDFIKLMEENANDFQKLLDKGRAEIFGDLGETLSVMEGLDGTLSKVNEEIIGSMRKREKLLRLGLNKLSTFSAIGKEDWKKVEKAMIPVPMLDKIPTNAASVDGIRPRFGERDSGNVSQSRFEKIAKGLKVKLENGISAIANFEKSLQTPADAEVAPETKTE